MTGTKPPPLSISPGGGSIHELGFQVSEEQDPRCEVIFGCGGCDMGDAVPLPTMVGVLNACMFRELMQDGEEDLAMSILMEEEE